MRRPSKFMATFAACCLLVGCASTKNETSVRNESPSQQTLTVGAEYTLMNRYCPQTMYSTSTKTGNHKLATGQVIHWSCQPGRALVTAITTPSDHCPGYQNPRCKVNWTEVSPGISGDLVELLLGTPDRLAGSRWYYTSVHGSVDIRDGAVISYTRPNEAHYHYLGSMTPGVAKPVLETNKTLAVQPEPTKSKQVADGAGLNGFELNVSLPFCGIDYIRSTYNQACTVVDKSVRIAVKDRMQSLPEILRKKCINTNYTDPYCERTIDKSAKSAERKSISYLTSQDKDLAADYKAFQSLGFIPGKTELSKNVALKLKESPLHTNGILSAEEIFTNLERSVFYVGVRFPSGDVGSGSAVAITRSLVVTNCHVVTDKSGPATGISIENIATGYISGAVLQTSYENKDLCVLKVTKRQLKPVPIGSSQSLSIGSTVFTIGAPKGLDLTISDGLLSQKRTMPEITHTNGFEVLQISAPITFGSSGGGLFNNRGELVGITTSGVGEGNLNFAMPVEWISKHTN